MDFASINAVPENVEKQRCKFSICGIPLTLQGYETNTEQKHHFGCNVLARGERERERDRDRDRDRERVCVFCGTMVSNILYTSYMSENLVCIQFYPASYATVPAVSRNKQYSPTNLPHLLSYHSTRSFLCTHLPESGNTYRKFCDLCQDNPDNHDRRICKSQYENL